MNNYLSTLKAFKAMQKFLERYYQRTDSNDVAVLLSGMLPSHDETMTMDSAAWEDWLDAIDEVLKQNK